MSHPSWYCVGMKKNIPVLRGPFTHENLSVFVLEGARASSAKNYRVLQEALQHKEVLLHETGVVGQLEARAPNLIVERRENDWRVVETRPADEAKAVLTRFLNAVDARDWEKAWSLLSASLRSRYTPDRFRDDFQREPLAKERVRKARLALRGNVKVTNTDATIALGADRAVQLVLEEGEYRVAAIE